MIFIIVFNLICISYGMVLICAKYRKWKARKDKCICKVQSRVVNILERKTARGGMVYKPIFAFCLDGRECQISSAYYSSLVKFDIGKQVELLINPNDYQQFLYVKDEYNKGRMADVCCCAMPFIFAIMITGMFLAN